MQNAIIIKWLSLKNTLEYLGVWEKINNLNFNYPEFEVIEKESGINRFIMSISQWISRTNAARMLVKAGRFGGTYANKDIVFHFGIWISSKYYWCYSNRLLILS